MSKHNKWEVSMHAAERMLHRIVGIPNPTEEEKVEAQMILWSFMPKAKRLPERDHKAKRRSAMHFRLEECDEHPAMTLRVMRKGQHRVVLTLLE